jgi:hypothetical protein
MMNSQLVPLRAAFSFGRFRVFASPAGANGYKPVPGDYDGDGKIDAAVFRPSDTNWYILKSTGGVQIQQFGLANDIPLPNAFVR